MRTNERELIGLNIKDITQEERDYLGNIGLNSCDICGIIDKTEELIWIQSEPYWNKPWARKLVELAGVAAICKGCLNKR